VQGWIIGLQGIEENEVENVLGEFSHTSTSHYCQYDLFCHMEDDNMTTSSLKAAMKRYSESCHCFVRFYVVFYWLSVACIYHMLHNLYEGYTYYKYNRCLLASLLGLLL
jgi:hypothetical protein